MSIVRIQLDPASEQRIRRSQDAPQLLLVAMQGGLKQGLEEMTAHLQQEYFVGWGGSKPEGKLFLRSGALRQAATNQLDGELSGFVGTLKGPASKYAGVQLGDQTWKIVPKKAKNLWIPIADNIGPGGVPRMSPREAMNKKDGEGKRHLEFFVSAKGSLLAFLPDDKGGTYKRGKKKGLRRGKLLFVLVKSVEVKGTDALAQAVNDKTDRLRDILDAAVFSALGGGL